MIFDIPTTRDISKLSQIEISLVVFMPNITTTHAITYTNNLSRTTKQAEIYFMKCILIKYLEEFISSLIKPFIGKWVIFGNRVLTL